MLAVRGRRVDMFSERNGGMKERFGCILRSVVISQLFCIFFLQAFCTFHSLPKGSFVSASSFSFEEDHWKVTG